MNNLLLAGLLLAAPLAAQEIPMATALPGNPFVLKNTWVIGGIGLWDYLAMDPVAERLYIAHGPVVQVVDVKAGKLVAQVTGLREAHDIALDESGEFGYVSDGPAQAVRIFNRTTYAIEATIPIGCSPRAVALERQTQLLFAVCGAAAGRLPAPVRVEARNVQPAPAAQGNQAGVSHIVAVDVTKRVAVADMLIPGDVRFAAADNDHRVYFTVGAAEANVAANGQSVRRAWPARIARLDASTLATDAERAQNGSGVAQLDWLASGGESHAMHLFPLNAACRDPQGLAADNKHLRLFVACSNQRLVVLNAESGELVASLVTGPGSDVVGFDQERGLIFSANGNGYGSLTIVSQDSATESYAVIQNLPTRERARTLAVNSSTGDVYLVTDLKGVDLTRPGGIGTLKATDVNGSFQVLVIGH